MCLHIDISGDAELALREAFGAGLDRAALEALAIEGYRTGKFGRAGVRRLLGLKDRWETDKWLADRGVCVNYSIEDLKADRETLDRLLGKIE
jgi:hypothetical protein